MNYPPPPWTIQGYGFFNVHLLEIEKVRQFVPSEFKVISVFPGKTVGGVFIASYGSSSTLVYNELIVVSGLVSHANKIGSWISHIYVDNPDSVAGGREIWGLPKELAQFRWDTTQQPSVQVTQDDHPLCTMTSRWRSPGLPLPAIPAPVFSTLDTTPLLFQATGTFNLQLSRNTLDVPPASPFVPLHLGQSWLSFYSDRLSVVAGVPELMTR